MSRTERAEEHQTPAEATGISGAPIYNSLLDEHGDVLREARRAAEQAQEEVKEALDFSDLLTPDPEEP